MDVRLLRSSDIPHVQQANITNLPENYFCKYYLYHALSWPQLSYVAVDVSRISLVTVTLSFTSYSSVWLRDTKSKEQEKGRSAQASGYQISMI